VTSLLLRSPISPSTISDAARSPDEPRAFKLVTAPVDAALKLPAIEQN